MQYTRDIPHNLRVRSSSEQSVDVFRWLGVFHTIHCFWFLGVLRPFNFIRYLDSSEPLVSQLYQSQFPPYSQSRQMFSKNQIEKKAHSSQFDFWVIVPYRFCIHCNVFVDFLHRRYLRALLPVASLCKFSFTSRLSSIHPRCAFLAFFALLLFRAWQSQCKKEGKTDHNPWQSIHEAHTQDL